MKEGLQNVVFKASTPKEAWNNVTDAVDSMRRSGDFVKIFPDYLEGELLFGLKEPAITRIIESVSLMGMSLESVLSISCQQT